jgi:hypothetical protein
MKMEPQQDAGAPFSEELRIMYGTIAKLRVKSGCREALLRFVEAMPNLPGS